MNRAAPDSPMTPARPLRGAPPLINPLWTRGWRSRARLYHLLSWGLVTLTIACFISLLTYMTITQRGIAPSEDAAKAALPGLIIIQAILLMVVGTGAVAGGIARERDEGLLDYQRMTPMSPTARIIGHLLGLPIREYVLVALTLPLIGVAVWMSGFSVATLAHFYVVFFLAVALYHMTALVAGMVAPNPRMASMVSVGMVVVLYLVLPGLSQIGLTFFEFLTVRPTFFGLIQQELPDSVRSVAATRGIERFRDVPFYTTTLHPTLFTLIVQAFALATMFTIVHRRWRNEAAHLLSKVGAVVVFAGITTFLLGSVWAIVTQDDAYDRVFSRFAPLALGGRSLESLAILLLAFLLILGVTALVLVTVITPDRSTTVEGWRRARKLGRTTLALHSDAASSALPALAMLAMILAAGTAAIWLAARTGDYFEQPPSALAVTKLTATVIGLGLLIQGLRERLGLRGFVITLFVLWVVPLFSMMILVISFSAYVGGAYVGLPCPPIAMAIGVAEVFDSTRVGAGVSNLLTPPELDGSGPRLALAGAASALVSGLLVQFEARRHRRRLKRAGL